MFAAASNKQNVRVFCRNHFQYTWFMFILEEHIPIHLIIKKINSTHFKVWILLSNSYFKSEIHKEAHETDCSVPSVCAARKTTCCGKLSFDKVAVVDYFQSFEQLLKTSHLRFSSRLTSTREY